MSALLCVADSSVTVSVTTGHGWSRALSPRIFSAWDHAHVVTQALEMNLQKVLHTYTLFVATENNHSALRIWPCFS